MSLRVMPATAAAHPGPSARRNPPAGGFRRPQLPMTPSLTVCLAGAGRAQEDDVLPGVEEVELAEVLDHLAADRALEGEVELLERLAGGEAGRLDPALA